MREHYSPADQWRAVALQVETTQTDEILDTAWTMTTPHVTRCAMQLITFYGGSVAGWSSIAADTDSVGLPEEEVQR